MPAARIFDHKAAAWEAALAVAPANVVPFDEGHSWLVVPLDDRPGRRPASTDAGRRIVAWTDGRGRRWLADLIEYRGERSKAKIYAHRPGLGSIHRTVDPASIVLAPE